MRALFFVKPLEIVLETEKDFFRQGDQIQGVLKITNQSNSPYLVEKESLTLSFGDQKKVHAQSDKALSDCASIIDIENIEIEPQKTKEFNIDFFIPSNGPILTLLQAPFFVVFKKPYSLQIKPHLYLEETLKILESFFRFRLKKTTYNLKKKMVEFQLIGSASGQLKSIESLSLMLSFDNKSLKLEYNFKIKTFENDFGMHLKKVTKTKKITSTLQESDFTYGPEILNTESLKRFIELSINECLPKSLI